MLPAATVRALTIPAFTAGEFTPTQWASAEDKAKFANALMKFIAHEFPRRSFTQPFYRRLSNTLGHIAHGSLDGFYGAFFERDLDKLVFLEQTLSWPHFGDPTFTFSDVERAVKRRLRAAKVSDIFRLLEADATRRRESRRSPACSNAKLEAAIEPGTNFDGSLPSFSRPWVS